VPRARLWDYMQDYPFWLLDVSPALEFPFFVFLPILGFSSISAPEITIETKEIQPGNWLFKKHKVSHASVGPITLIRGAQFFDSDYWRWIYKACTGGGKQIKRNLLLVHYLGYSMSGLKESNAASPLAASVGLAAELSTSGAIGVGAAVGAAVFEGIVGVLGGDLFEKAGRIPGRAWMLRDCLPTRYKVASDFDATSSNVSLMELDVQPEYFEEISLASI